MSGTRQPRIKRTPVAPVPPVIEEVNIWPETPVEPFVPSQPPTEAVQTPPSEPRRVLDPLPESVAKRIEDFSALIPNPEDRERANRLLAEATQDIITKIRAKVEADALRDVNEIREKLTEMGKKKIEEKLLEIQKASGPQSAEDMRKLVSQEYVEFPLAIPEVMDDEDEEPQIKMRHFKIREIPQAAEKRMVAMLTVHMLPLLSKFQGVRFAAGTSQMDKIQQAVKVIPEMSDLIADGVVICLNPYERLKDIDRKWVQSNLSSSRMMAILEAQFMANRIRDFFYSVSRVSLGT